MEILTSTRSSDSCLEAKATMVKNFPAKDGSSVIRLCWFAANTVSLQKQKGAGHFCTHVLLAVTAFRLKFQFA